MEDESLERSQDISIERGDGTGGGGGGEDEQALRLALENSRRVFDAALVQNDDLGFNKYSLSLIIVICDRTCFGGFYEGNGSI